MIRAIIFDCFGVLTTDGWLAFKQQRLAPGSQAEAEATELNRQYDAGFIAHEDFVRGVAELAGVAETEAWRIIDKSHAVNDQLFDYIRDDLKPRFKIGLLSNAGANYVSELFAPWQVGLFDAMTFSFELGVVKPHPAMYQTIAAKLGVLPSECVFIDDREPFVVGALDAGMESFQFKDTAQTGADLAQILRSHRA